MTTNTRHTTIAILDDGTVEITTVNKQWINHMDGLVEAGHAEEIEPQGLGHSYWFDESLLRKPFYRKPRKFTEEQKAAARERLAKARTTRKATKAKPAPKTSPSPKK